MVSPDEEFAKKSRSLESAYLQSDDPIVQSGFSGGRERWVGERSPLVEVTGYPPGGRGRSDGGVWIVG